MSEESYPLWAHGHCIISLVMGIICLPKEGEAISQAIKLESSKEKSSSDNQELNRSIPKETSHPTIQQKCRQFKETIT